MSDLRVPPPSPGDVAVERELQDAMAKEIDRTMPKTVADLVAAKDPPHHELVFAIVLRAHAQPRPGEEAQQYMPSFRAARREGMGFYAALQRLCERHGYQLGAQSMLQHRVATHVEGESTRGRAEGL